MPSSWESRLCVLLQRELPRGSHKPQASVGARHEAQGSGGRKPTCKPNSIFRNKEPLDLCRKHLGALASTLEADSHWVSHAELGVEYPAQCLWPQKQMACSGALLHVSSIVSWNTQAKWQRVYLGHTGSGELHLWSHVTTFVHSFCFFSGFFTSEREAHWAYKESHLLHASVSLTSRLHIWVRSYSVFLWGLFHLA